MTNRELMRGICLLCIKIAVVIFAVVISYKAFSFYQAHTFTQNIDDFNSSDTEKERLFLESGKTKEEIESYLSDATILISHPSLSVVTYLDAHHKIWDWAGNSLSTGGWYLKPMLVKLTYRGKVRRILVYSLCRNFESLISDNCILIWDNIYPVATGPQERASGDVFGLAKAKKPPFSLPLNAVSLESLRAKMGDSPNSPQNTEK